MLRWKEIIGPGEYWYEDKDGVPRKFVATPEACQYWCDQGNKMLSHSLSIPIPVEHQQELVPLTPSQKAASQLLNNAGEIKKYKLHGETLFGLCDIQDPKVDAKIPRTIKYTSPTFGSFTDGDGRKWDGVITHLALTSRPRIHRQQPFGSAAAALSLAKTSSTFDAKQVPAQGFSLSRAGRLTKHGVPKYPLAFSIWSGVVQLAEGTFPPEKKDKEGKEEPPEKKKGGEDKEPREEEALEMLSEVEDDMDLVDVVKDLMSIYGVDLDEATEESNLLQNLLRALTEKLKADHGVGMGDDTMAGSDTMGSGSMGGVGKAPVVETPPLYMSVNLSQEAVDKIVDPREKEWAKVMLSMQQKSNADSQRLAALEKSKIADAAKARTGRIQRVIQRAGQSGREALQKQLTDMAALPAMAFSLKEDGAVEDPMKTVLDSLDTAMLDLPVMLGGSKTTEEPHPIDIGDGTITEESRKTNVEKLAKAVGVEKKPAA